MEAAVNGGKLDLLYIAPERLLQERTLEWLDGQTIALFAIDEAHCVSRWGHDFREEYLQLSVLHERYPSVPRIALTATADHATPPRNHHPTATGGGQLPTSTVVTVPTSATPFPTTITGASACGAFCKASTLPTPASSIA